MRASSLLVLALVATVVVVSYADTTPSADIGAFDLESPELPGRLLKELKVDSERASRDALQTLRDHDSLQSRLTAVVLPRGDDACCKCVGETAHHIISETYNQVQTACANVTCPVIKKECEWIESHEDRYKGFLVARIRPAGLGFSYCMGTGDCKHPNYTRIEEVSTDKNDATYLDMQLETLVGQVIRSSMNRTSRADGEKKRFGEDEEGEHKISEVATGDDKDRRHHCLRKSIKWVMRHAIKSFIRHCKHTQCPFEQKVCKFANEHRDLTHGFIYGKVEPWKFAIGYCAGRHHGRRMAQE